MLNTLSQQTSTKPRQTSPLRKMTSSERPTSNGHHHSRLSLQEPFGLPSIPSDHAQSKRRSLQVDTSILPDTDECDGPDANTLISCLTHLSVSSLPSPYIEGVAQSDRRFPSPTVSKSSPLGSRQEQRRIYLGPKLSDRATGGPDAGPLIERFTCLFKDRELQTTQSVWLMVRIPLRS